MGIKLIFFGMIFLVNPNIATLDILPDFIGFILILVGTNKLYDLSSKIQESRKSFYILTFISAFKLLTVALVPVVGAKEYTWIIIFTMCFSIAEAILLVLAFSKLISGFSFLGMLYNEEAAYQNTNIFGMSATFFVLKSVLSFAPFISYIFSMYGDSTYFLTKEINISFLSNTVQIFNILAVLVFGLFWITLMHSYFMGMLKKDDFIAKIEKDYVEKIGNNIPLKNYRAIKVFLLLITVAIFFVIDLRFDGIDVLPDFVSATLFFAAGLYMLRRYKKHCKIMIVLSSLYFVFALAGWTLSVLFTTKYFDYSFQLGYAEVVGHEVRYNYIAYREYVTICIIEGIKGILFTLVFFTAIPPIKDIIANHTGVPSEVVTESTITREKKIKKRLGFTIDAIKIFAAVCALSSVVALALKFYISDFTMNPDDIMFYTSTISVVFSVLLFGFVLYYRNRLITSIEYKYLF